MSKFTKYPLKDENLIKNESAIKDFVKGALAKIEPTPDNNIYEWSNLDDIEKTKGINLRITKADLAKLQYISKVTPYSIQGFCYESVKKAIEQKLKEVI